MIHNQNPDSLSPESTLYGLIPANAIREHSSTPSNHIMKETGSISMSGIRNGSTPLAFHMGAGALLNAPHAAIPVTPP